jgi:TusA-related sulfurtransferase
VAWEAVAEFKRALNLRKSGEVNPYADSPMATNGSNGWVVLDGRGKSCAGVIAALTKQMEADGQSFVEAIMSDALNIYDLTVWTEQTGHRMLTQRKESDGTLRVLIQPFAESR